MIRKLPLAILIFFLLPMFTIGQETAMDFDQADCSGNSHHLFSELDAGKVVILEFVMLNCAPCITATKALEKIRSPFDEQYPGRVVLYSMGFLNAYTCTQMQAWMTNNNFTHSVFTGGEQQVSYYGGMGMPTIIVIGGNDHKVYFKSSGYTPSLDGQIKAAVDSSLAHSTLGIEEKITVDHFSVYPSFSSDNFTFRINFHAAQEISICNLMGQQVMSVPVSSHGNYTISASQLPDGIYITRLKTTEGYSRGIKLIKQ